MENGTTREATRPYGSRQGAVDAVVQSILGRRGSPIAHLELLLTLDCNHECDYCFVHGKRRSADMPVAVLRRAVDFLLVASRGVGAVSILPFGGEPLLRFDLVQEVIEYAEHAARDHRPPKTVTFSLTTNGTLLDGDRMAFFRNHGIMVLLSLDGRQETHDRHRHMKDGRSSYRAVTDRLSMMKKYQPWLGTRMTVHPDSSGHMCDDFEYLISLGINQFLIGPATGVPWAGDQWAAYEEQMLRIIRLYANLRRWGTPLRVTMFEHDAESEPKARKGQWGCGAGRGRIAVTPDGSLYPCSKLVGVDDLRATHGLGDIWAGITEYRKRGELFIADEERRPTCGLCEFRDDCTGGCPATNYEETGSLFLPSWLDCAQTRLMVRLRRELDSIGEIEPMHPRSLKHI